MRRQEFREELELRLNTPSTLTHAMINFGNSFKNKYSPRQIWNERGIFCDDNISAHTSRLYSVAHMFCIHERNSDYRKLTDKLLVHAWHKEVDNNSNSFGFDVDFFLNDTYLKVLTLGRPLIRDYVRGIWKEYHLVESEDDSVLHELHDMDNLVSALKIAKICKKTDIVEDVIDDAYENLSHPLLVKISNYLIENEYPSLDFFTQYKALMVVNGDIDKFRKCANYALTP